MTKVEQNRETTTNNSLHNFVGRGPVGPLGNYTNYFAKPKNQVLTKTQLNARKYEFRKLNIERKNKIGEKVTRVKDCGCKQIRRSNFVDVVQAENGSVYYKNVQRCGCVWFCPFCMFKLMKRRSEELCKQLIAYKQQGKTVLFVTLTIQHNAGDSLKSVKKGLLGAFQYANSHRQWIEVKKHCPVEFLRVLEVLKSKNNGWHPHLHCLFVGNAEILYAINVFLDLYKKNLSDQGLLINENTVVVETWNGKLNALKDKVDEYVFKGSLEKEFTGASMKTSKQGKTFFELIDEGDDSASGEYMVEMKGTHQYHHSKGFFKDVRVKTDEEILKDDIAAKILFSIRKTVYADMIKKGIALHFLNEYMYGGTERAVKFLELYDCDTEFMMQKT